MCQICLFHSERGKGYNRISFYSDGGGGNMESVLLSNQNSFGRGVGGCDGCKQTSGLGAKQILFYPLPRVKGNSDLGVKQM